MNTGSSNFIGIVTAGFDNPFRSKLLSPLVHQLALNGFMPLLMNADDPQQLAPLRQLLSYHVAGGGSLSPPGRRRCRWRRSIWSEKSR